MDKNSFKTQFIEYTKSLYDYVEIGGIKWAKRNVGAKNETDMGLYFQWGNPSGYTFEQARNRSDLRWDDYPLCTFNLVYRMDKYNIYDLKMTLDPEDDAATVNMGNFWRTPTVEEFNNLFKLTAHIWVGDYKGSGVSGMLFTDRTDETKELLFFPADSDTHKFSFLNKGYYWSSSLLDVDNKRMAFNFHFDCSGFNTTNLSYRYQAFSVRAVLK